MFGETLRCVLGTARDPSPQQKDGAVVRPLRRIRPCIVKSLRRKTRIELDGASLLDPIQSLLCVIWGTQQILFGSYGPLAPPLGKLSTYRVHPCADLHGIRKLTLNVQLQLVAHHLVKLRQIELLLRGFAEDSSRHRLPIVRRQADLRLHAQFRTAQCKFVEAQRPAFIDIEHAKEKPDSFCQVLRGVKVRQGCQQRINGKNDLRTSVRMSSRESVHFVACMG